MNKFFVSILASSALTGVGCSYGFRPISPSSQGGQAQTPPQRGQEKSREDTIPESSYYGALYKVRHVIDSGKVQHKILTTFYEDAGKRPPGSELSIKLLIAIGANHRFQIASVEIESPKSVDGERLPEIVRSHEASGDWLYDGKEIVLKNIGLVKFTAENIEHPFKVILNSANALRADKASFDLKNEVFYKLPFDDLRVLQD